MSKSKIEWTDATWNPVTGCTKVSAGCKHCYAEREWPRMTKLVPAYTGRAFTDVRCHPERLDQPLRWKRPRKVFVNSMSDLFHEDVPVDFIRAVFEVMARCPQHTFQILTKRAERMQFLLWSEFDWMPLPNVWIGVSVENQETADERIPLLLETPAAVRWISMEPLLGFVNVWHWLGDLVFPFDDQNITSRGIDWVVAGGESGPKARPSHPEWFRSLRDQCKAAGVAFMMKQWGEWTPGENVSRRTGTVASATWFDERWLFGIEDLACEDGHCDDQPDLYRVGKKAAGRLLDGVLHDGYPEVQR